MKNIFIRYLFSHTEGNEKSFQFKVYMYDHPLWKELYKPNVLNKLDYWEVIKDDDK